MRVKIALNIFLFIFLAPIICNGQDKGDEEIITNKRGVFTVGFSPDILLNSFEKFNTLGNRQLLSKRNFASTQSVDREGKRNRNIKNFFFGASVMYRVTDKQNNFWGVELGYDRGNTAFSYFNIESFNFPTTRSSTVEAWISWNVTNKFSLSLHKAWGKRDDLKWYAKLKSSYVRLATVDDKKGDFVEEWLNDHNTGGIWEGKVLNKNSFSFTPEFGRQLILETKGKDWLFFIGLGYQIGLLDMYELKYYSVSRNTKSLPNSIKVGSNNLAIKFALHIPISSKPITPKPEKKVVPKIKEVAPKQYSQNNLVFLLDVSISMAQDGKLKLLKEYMANMLDSLPPYDYITIITFSGNAKLVLKPTQVIDKEEILSTLENIEPKGGTDANRGIKKAYDVLRKNYIEKGNNRIIVATDGVFKTNRKSRDLIAENLATKNIKLSVFHFVGDRTTSASSLKELAAIGGGNYALVNETNITDKLAEEYKQKVD